MVDLIDDLVFIYPAGCASGIIVHVCEGLARERRRRKGFHYVRCDSADSIRGNDISGEQLASIAAVGLLRGSERIGNDDHRAGCGKGLREIAGRLQARGDGRNRRSARHLPVFVHVDEEERLVTLDRSPESASELVLIERRPWVTGAVLEEVVGVQNLVAKVLVE